MPNSFLEQLKSAHEPRALFTEEGPQYAQRAYAHNAPYAVPGPYQTKLNPADELNFTRWLRASNVPFNPNDPTSDYDMRRFWLEQPQAAAAWRPGAHFPDIYKTPYDTTFSGESRYARPNTPFMWIGDNLVDMSTG